MQRPQRPIQLRHGATRTADAARADIRRPRRHLRRADPARTTTAATRPQHRAKKPAAPGQGTRSIGCTTKYSRGATHATGRIPTTRLRRIHFSRRQVHAGHLSQFMHPRSPSISTTEYAAVHRPRHYHHPVQHQHTLHRRHLPSCRLARSTNRPQRVRQTFSCTGSGYMHQEGQGPLGPHVWARPIWPHWLAGTIPHDGGHTQEPSAGKRRATTHLQVLECTPTSPTGGQEGGDAARRRR